MHRADANGRRLRVLVACGVCGLQVDATGRRPGDRFRCACGELVEVPAGGEHEAAVVRCSACGGTREAGALSCAFCGSDFTLHEQDLDTLCPGCFARISHRSRFCHHCGLAIAPQEVLGEATTHPCPRCGEPRTLAGRRLSRDLAALECGRCGGLWLARAVFEHLEEQASSGRRPWSGEDGNEPRTPLEHADGPLYRPCPLCLRLMHRRNYGRRSGVVIDRCAEHGAWFDSGELEAVLRWIRRGGLARARRLEDEEAREEGSRRRRLDAIELPASADRPWPGRGRPGLLGGLLDLLSRF